MKKYKIIVNGIDKGNKLLTRFEVSDLINSLELLESWNIIETWKIVET